MRATLGILVALSLGCTHTRAAELSAKEHRAEAKTHEAEATKAKAAYDPGAARVETVGVTPREAGDPLVTFRTYNPTEEHLRRAELHARAAHQHTEAALLLEKTVLTECAGTPAEGRTSCPLLTPYLRELEETAAGVVLRFTERAPTPTLAQQMRCQVAVAKARAYQAPTCPLYQRGVEVRLVDERTIELRTMSPAVAADIREEARRMFATSAPPPRG